MITQRKNSAVLILLCLTIHLKVSCMLREASPDHFIDKLLQIEQEIKNLEQQQQKLATQQSSMQQKLAKQQEELLYKEQEHKEWRTKQKEKLAQIDAVIKKLEKEHDFAESERLKVQKKQQEEAYAAQNAPQEDVLEKQRVQLEQNRKEYDRLRQLYEKATENLTYKSKQQREIIDVLVAKMNALHASKDIVTLRKAKADLKKKIETLKASSLKEVSIFVDLLQVPLQGIKQRISYLEQAISKKFNQQIAQIRRNISAAKRTQEFDKLQLAVDDLKKNVDLQPLSKSQKRSLLNHIEKDVEPLLLKKITTAQPQDEQVATVSHTKERQEVSTQKEEEPDSDLHQKEGEPVEKETEQTKKEENVAPKTTNKTIIGFVLNKDGNFEQKEYQNVVITTGPKGNVTRIVYNNQDIKIVPVPSLAEDTHDNTPEWIAAEIYLQQLGDNPTRIGQLVKQSTIHYEQQEGYDQENPKYNQKLLDYLRLGLMPMLEFKTKK